MLEIGHYLDAIISILSINMPQIVSHGNRKDLTHCAFLFLDILFLPLCERPQASHVAES